MSTSARRDALTLGFANGINVLSQGSLIAFVALYSDAADVGALAAAIAVTTPIMFFVQGRVQDLVATSGAGVGGALATLRRLVGTGIVWGTALSAVIGVALGLDRGAIVTIVFIALARGAEAGCQLAYGYRLHRGDPAGMARSLYARSFLTVVAAVGLLSFWPTSTAAGIAMFAAWFTTYLVVDRPVLPRDLPTTGVDPKTMRGYSRRLGATYALSALIPSIPRLGLLLVGSTTALGRFAVVAFISRAPVPVAIAMGQALGPSMAAQHREGRRPRALRLALGLNLAFALIWIPAGYFIITTVVPRVLGAQYEVSLFTTAALLSSAGLLFLAFALDQFAIAARETHWNLAVLIITVVVCLVATYAVVPLPDLDGAALALLTANLVRFGTMMVLVRRWTRAAMSTATT